MMLIRSSPSLNAGASINDAINEEVKKKFSDPFVEKLVGADVEANADKYAGKFVAKILDDATDKQTRRLDSEYIFCLGCSFFKLSCVLILVGNLLLTAGDKLQETISKLKSVRKAGMHGRSLDDESLEEKCDGIVTGVRDFIKVSAFNSVLVAIDIEQITITQLKVYDTMLLSTTQISLLVGRNSETCFRTIGQWSKQSFHRW